MATTSFTASGSTNWTAPLNVFSVTADCKGGGGAGGGATGTAAGGGGGSGGAFARKYSIPVVPGSSYPVVVGAGGTGGTGVGGVGGSTWFFLAGSVNAQGGIGGRNCIANSSGSFGGTALTASCIGDLKFAGGNGGSATSLLGGAGGGGPGETGVGGNASGTTRGTAATSNGGLGGGAPGNTQGNGTVGAIYGAGGGGAHATSTTDQTGGAGAIGRIDLYYTTPKIFGVKPF